MSNLNEDLIFSLEKMLPWFDYYIFRAKNTPGGYTLDLIKHKKTVELTIKRLKELKDKNESLHPL